MNVLAVYAVNEHIADLLAEAGRERLARKPKSKGLVASLVAAVRDALAPQSLPRLEGYPYRN